MSRPSSGPVAGIQGCYFNAWPALVNIWVDVNTSTRPLNCLPEWNAYADIASREHGDEVEPIAGVDSFATALLSRDCLPDDMVLDPVPLL